ncbi:MAG: peptidase S16 [Gammaproteobacteria bacterium]|nr:MAG: peptidase S16 [Gammaproteobacteria bacterium]
MHELPLFPLNSVIFPGGALPLRLFEPRYLDMVKDCMRNEHGFGIALIKDGKEMGQEVGLAAEVYKTGTECRIADWEMLPDGLLGITAYGEKKIHIEDTHIRSNQLLVGQVQCLVADPDVELPEEFESMRSLLQKVITQVGKPYTTLPAGYDYAGWVGARLTELLPLQLATKQRLLEIDDHIVRLYHLKEAMQDSKFL